MCRSDSFVDPKSTGRSAGSGGSAQLPDTDRSGSAPYGDSAAGSGADYTPRSEVHCIHCICVDCTCTVYTRADFTPRSVVLAPCEQEPPTLTLTVTVTNRTSN